MSQHRRDTVTEAHDLRYLVVPLLIIAALVAARLLGWL